MIAPVLVTAPTGVVVDLDTLKTHLRVDGDDDNDLLEKMEQSAVSKLDGWSGVLGRCILPQTWRQDFEFWGELRLAFPDVTDARVSYFNGQVETAFSEVELGADGRGAFIMADGPTADLVRVEFDCELPDTLLPSAEKAIRLMVANEYLDREGLQAGDAFQKAVREAIGHITWTNF